MLLCLDVGNTQLHGGIFDREELRCQFRKSTQPHETTDELGIFFTTVLRENGIDPKAITAVAICCVVPSALYSLRGASTKYFHCEPFILQAGVKTGLKVRYRNPHEVGADRIAGAIAAAQRRPGRDLIVVDCGTATTFDVITSGGDYLGGAIMPGVGVSAEALASRTAKLPRVEITRPETSLGRTTSESIQSGLFYGHVGAILHMVKKLTREIPGAGDVHVIGTGGFARMLESESVFHEVVPELVLAGLRHAEGLNRTELAAS